MKPIAQSGNMKRLGQLALLAIVILLNGCHDLVSKDRTALAVAQSKPVVTFAQANRCLDDLNQSELGQSVFSQILYSSTIAPKYNDLETSMLKLSDAQVDLLKEFRDKNNVCRSLRSQAFKEYELRVQLAIFHDEMDHMLDDLQNKQITIGEGNRQSKQIRARYQSEVRKFFERSKDLDEERVG